MFIVSHIPGSYLQKIHYERTETQLPINNSFKQVTVHDLNAEEDLQVTAQSLNKIIEELKNLDVQDYKNLDCDHKTFFECKKSIDAADVLKAGIILASIKNSPDLNYETNRSCFNTNTTCFDLKQDEPNINYITWDWWTNTAMDWLAKTSKIIEKFDWTPQYNNFNSDKYTDMCIANRKKLELEDQVHKATKIRIQDQLERSWHMEWTDTVKGCILGYKPTLGHYLQDFKL